MPFDLPEALDQLQRTPAVLERLLAGTAPALHDRDEGPGTWSPRQVVGHLIYTDEEIWPRRAATIREHGEARSFAPGDPAVHLARFATTPVDELLERFAAVRAASLATVEGWGLADGDLARRGRHTYWGAVTLGEILAAWAVHDLNHLAQITRVLAGRWRDEVGALRDSLPILDRRKGGTDP